MIDSESINKKISRAGKLQIDDGILRSEKLITVEGQDEVYFFDALLRYLEILDVEIREFGGKTKFIKKIKAINTLQNIENLKKLAIIRDADTDDINLTFESITDILKVTKIDDNTLIPPEKIGQFSHGLPKIGIYVMPDNKNNGMLEDLCLKTVNDTEAMKCVEIFYKCAEELKGSPKIPAKSKAQVFLAAMPKIVNSVGLGAQKKYWNFDSKELEELKTFLNNFKES